MKDTPLMAEARELIAFYDDRGWNWASVLGFILCRSLFGPHFRIIDYSKFDIRRKRKDSR